MSDPRTCFRDTAYQKAIEDTTVTFTNNIRDEWRRREETFKARLETIRREREAAEAEFQSMEDTTKQDFDYLVDKFTVDRVRPVWEEQGELMPPTIRGLLGELRGPSHSLLSPALSSADNGTRQESNRPPLSDDTMEQEVTVTIQSSEPSREESPSTKRSAEASDSSSDSTVNKRQRISDTGYTFRASEEASRFRGTVMFYEVDGYHWAFRSPITGPGFYVLICDDSDRDAFRFQSDPWLFQRALKHYTKDHECHDDYIDRPLHEVSESMIMQRYGYLVEDMTEESFRSSNQRIEDERPPKKQKPRSTYKKPPVHAIQRNAPVADMGSYGNAYVQPTVEDYIPNQGAFAINMLPGLGISWGRGSE